ncbi:hypothetical protein FOZ61_000916 [Perkinsus olseni]|uniref:Uncharacterized protein n=1 Tax=Perkinsus olseni TaxID=32597 RepID=A0A7J6MFC0_PEROL|nr:hypothetical protein FOZ61_000916 [Perkinsus olseni]
MSSSTREGALKQDGPDASSSSTSVTDDRRHAWGAISSPLPTMAIKDAELADEFLRQLDSSETVSLFEDQSPGRDLAKNQGNLEKSRMRSAARPGSLQSLTLEVETIDEKILEARKMGLLGDRSATPTAGGINRDQANMFLNPARPDKNLITPNSANYLMTPEYFADSPTVVPLHSKVIRFLWAWIPLGSYKLTATLQSPARLSPDWLQQHDGAAGGSADVAASSTFSKNSTGGRQGSRSVWSRHADRLLLAVSESYPSFGIDRLSSSGAPSEFYRDEHVTFVARRRPLSLSAQTALGVPFVSAVWAFTATFVWPQFVSVPRAFSVAPSLFAMWMVMLFLWIALCVIHIFLLRPWQVTCCHGRRIVLETRWKSTATSLVSLLNAPPPIPEPGKSPPPLSPLPRDDFRQWKSWSSTIIVTVIFLCLLVACIMTLVMYKQCVECGGCAPSIHKGKIIYPDPSCYDYYISWIPGATVETPGYVPHPSSRPWFPLVPSR